MKFTKLYIGDKFADKTNSNIYTITKETDDHYYMKCNKNTPSRYKRKFLLNWANQHQSGYDYISVNESNYEIY